MGGNLTRCPHDPASNIPLFHPLPHMEMRGNMGQDNYASVTLRVIYTQKKRLAEKIRTDSNNLSSTRGRHQNLGQRMDPAPAIFITEKINSFMGPRPFFWKSRPPELQIAIPHPGLKKPTPEAMLIAVVYDRKEVAEVNYSYHLSPDPRGPCLWTPTPL